MAQWVKDPTASPQIAARIKGSILGPVQCGKDPVVAQIAAMSRIESLAQELPYASGMAKKKKKKKPEKQKSHNEKSSHIYQYNKCR